MLVSPCSGCRPPGGAEGGGEQKQLMTSGKEVDVAPGLRPVIANKDHDSEEPRHISLLIHQRRRVSFA